jgi:hypothetical protein
MSEKIYALLFRLYPSHFRETYGNEALQLFRDRARDEKGFLRTLRLWLDLLADLAISVPREYFYAEPELIAASGQRLSGTPLFYVVSDESPRPGALFLGGMLSLAALVTFSSLLSHGGNHRPRNTSARQLQRAAAPSSSASIRSSPQAADNTNSPGGAEDQAITSTAQPWDTGSSAQPMQEHGAAAIATAVRHGNLDAAERQRVIDGAIVNLKQHYIYPELARKMANALTTRGKRGDDDAMTDGETFANQLTNQIRDVSHDMHLELVYSEDPLPQHPSGQTPGGLARYREAMQQSNCTFERVEILPRNIGYLKLNSFPDRSVCERTATATMATLNNVDAMIFDLRDNRGGMPDMVEFMAAYLFDHPEYWYNPRENTTQQSWTLSPVPGNRLADKPVYVLTSARTISGAEQFCYDLKMLKRATLVGETTRGAAHSGVFHRIDDHFGIGIPETNPINPFSKTDWAVIGVEPDVKVKAADALQTAVKLAQSKLQKK